MISIWKRGFKVYNYMSNTTATILDCPWCHKATLWSKQDWKLVRLATAELRAARTAGFRGRTPPTFAGMSLHKYAARTSRDPQMQNPSTGVLQKFICLLKLWLIRGKKHSKCGSCECTDILHKHWLVVKLLKYLVWITK